MSKFAENIVPAVTEADAMKMRQCWSADTSMSDEWSAEVPEKGQCAVTAMLVQDLYGGVLNRAVVNGESHYWNTIASGEEVDFTRAQFEVPVVIEEQTVRERSYLEGSERTMERYRSLKEAFVNSRQSHVSDAKGRTEKVGV